MTTVFAEGGPDREITEGTRRRAVGAASRLAGDVSRTLVLPPDATRYHSGAGPLTCMLYEEIGASALLHVMPATGTHFPMTREEIARMFGAVIPPDAFKEHNWRKDPVRLGEVPADYVHEVSEDVLRGSMPDYGIPVEVNRRVVEGSYGAIFSVGQVVPHEVVGMANGVKNVLIGAGGQETINRSHFLGAAYGMERMMGRAETPVRKVLNYAHERYLAALGIVYILTVMARDAGGRMVMRGIYVGDDHATFVRAAKLARAANVTLVDEPLDRIVAYLPPEEFKSTWLGNKAIYRSRMAIADGGELLILAPGVRTFGEDPEIDRLARRFGYRGTPATLDAVREHEELRANLSAAAHLIHGSSEGRFRIVLATDPALLSRREVEGVGFEWRDVGDALRAFDPAALADGPNDGFYYISNPSLGLWAVRDRFSE